MLTRFSLDPEALLSASASEHKRLAREWLRYGVLCHNDISFGNSEIADVLAKLPQQARSLWKKVLKYAWLRSAPAGWPGIVGLEDHPDSISSLAGEVDLVCLEETRLALVQPEICVTCPKLELQELADIDTSRAFELSHSLAEKRTDGMRVNDFWTERFSLPASLTKSVTIVDRFALADGEGINGLESFMVKLDGQGRKVNVIIYSSYGDEKLRLSEKDAQDRVVHIRQRMARGGVGDITLYLTDSYKFGKVEHDRFLKFDHIIYELGSGMAVFNGSHAKQSTFSSKIAQDGHKSAIGQLGKLSGVEYPMYV